MKISNYNIFKKNDNGIIAYNSYRNSLIKLSNEEYQEYINFSNDYMYELDVDFKESLYKCGFLIEDSLNELEVLKYRMISGRYDKKVLGITIAPTLNCNFRCIYCYEKKYYKNKNMDEETQDAIINYLQNHVDDIEMLSITWYGGEPLLAIDCVKNLSKAFIKICKNKNIKYDAFMVTNGFLLDSAYANILKECEISGIQITLDGNEKEHNSKRFLVNGGKTYATIVENIRETCDFFNKVVVRMNCSYDNIESFNELHDYFKSACISNVELYMSPIRNIDGCYNNSSCISRDDFLEKEYLLLKKLPQVEFEKYVLNKYPFLTSNICGADKLNTLVISPEGDMYKCWSDLGNENLKFGNIRDLSKIEITNYIIYLNSEPYNDEKCKECKIYPICLGGCPYERRVDYKDKCEYNQEYLMNFMEDIVSIRE